MPRSVMTRVKGSRHACAARNALTQYFQTSFCFGELCGVSRRKGHVLEGTAGGRMSFCPKEWTGDPDCAERPLIPGLTGQWMMSVACLAGDDLCGRSSLFARGCVSGRSGAPRSCACRQSGNSGLIRQNRGLCVVDRCRPSACSAYLITAASVREMREKTSFGVV